MALEQSQLATKQLTSADEWHLLWRTGFGANLHDVDKMSELTLNEVVERIVQPQPEQEQFEATEQLLRNVALDTQNIDDLKAWWLYRIQHTTNPLNEKLVLMWHNHFATSYAKVQSVTHMMGQNELIRTHALADFKTMLHGMAEDVAMLIWLDGNANRKRHPNENFAREVMELFSLGVGNYTETDIKEAARAFTGWHVRNDRYWFNKLQHDTAEKTVLGKTGNLNGHDIVDLCLTQESCARFLAKKLLNTFVTFQPTEDHVNQLAATVTLRKFNLSDIMHDLLLSNMFWNPEYQHNYIKSPLEFVMGTYRALQAKPNYVNAGKLLKTLGQDLFEPPSVKGWEGGRQWINSTSLIQRMNFITALLTSDKAGRLEDLVDIDQSLRKALYTSPQPWCEYLLGKKLDQEIFKQVNVSGTGKQEEKIRRKIHYLLTLPEYQLM